MFPDWEFKEGWGTVALMLIMLLCVAWSIQAAAWTSGLSILQVIVLVGGVLGIVLAKARIPARLAHALALLMGLTWSMYLTSRTLAANVGLSFETAIGEFDRMLQGWLFALIAGGTSSGDIVFLFLLCLLFWLMAYTCAWSIFRWQQVWWAVILCGVALMVNLTYTHANLNGFLIAYIFFALLLVVRTNLTFYQQEWQEARIVYNSEVVYSFLRAGFVVILVATALSWLAPDVLASRPLQQVWDRLGEPWQKLQDQSTRLFQNLNYRNEPALISFTRSTKFGGAVELTDRPVMNIEADAGRYWRVVVFHEYTGDGWNNTDTEVILISENEPTLYAPEFQQRREVTQTITLLQNSGPRGTLAAAGQPLRVSVPSRAVVSLIAPDNNTGEIAGPSLLSIAPGDPSALYAQTPLKAGETYQAVSSVTEVTEKRLREAGTEYPTWIVPRYLQLSESVSEQTKQLAQQITAQSETPYDKAIAIEAFLRRIPYNEKIEAPAQGQDGVDYFLFERQEGYCDYYASAMVVMLREVGVPARYVRGYGQGQTEQGVYQVLEKDGHAWPEVFFPGYGWVEFEPTAGEPVLIYPGEDGDPSGQPDRRGRRTDRPEMEGIDTLDFGDREPISTPPLETLWTQVRPWVGLALLLAALFLLPAMLISVRRRQRMAELSLIERVYQDLVDWVQHLLKLHPLAHQTPHEYASDLSQLMPQGRVAVERITDLYVQERFGGKAINEEDVEGAWQETRSALWRRWLSLRVENVHRRLSRWVPGTRRSTWSEPDEEP